ncbi:hypothetical protein [Streptomyces broussonetiae]|uniref:hypothetical protein n=1 Tax=Streptomyces broussonetiae TaxID=2686304 RepID=UPI0035E31229
MNTRQDEDGDTAESVGVRQRTEVLAALDGLTNGTGADAPQFRAGEAVAYEWALGRAESSPATARGGRGVPDLVVLTAELDAVTAQLEEAKTDYLRGLRAALTWLCGYQSEPG